MTGAQRIFLKSIFILKLDCLCRRSCLLLFPTPVGTVIITVIILKSAFLCRISCFLLFPPCRRCFWCGCHPSIHFATQNTQDARCRYQLYFIIFVCSKLVNVHGSETAIWRPLNSTKQGKPLYPVPQTARLPAAT